MVLCCQEKNRSVNQALVSQASSVGQLEAHEHELRTVLKLKVRAKSVCLFALRKSCYLVTVWLCM